jgi:2-polyprenyl-3-methyl-5-hydroxy-6-metoxy-1,4-benzoquinol methylase
LAEILDLEKKYPLVFKTAKYLKNESSLFENTIGKQMKQNFNFELAERIFENGLRMANNSWDTYCSNLNNLIDMSIKFLRLQKNLEKTGKYLYSTFEEVEKNEYNTNNKDSDGPDYLWGLYFSEIFWKIHHNFFNFSLNDFMSGLPATGKVLEVPSGTGLFLCEFLINNPNWLGVGIDVADSSIKFSQKLLQINNIPNNSYKILKMNFHQLEPNEKYDRILCGEFLEHLEDPLAALKRLKSLLKDDGKLFITVAVWAAHVDHIFLYESSDQVREHIRKADLKIEKELVQAVFEKDEAEPEKEKIPVSYAAILS